MKLSAHQPAYIPWLGYIDKIARSDIFVIMDSVQFEKNSFINRNRIKTLQGPLWLTVPVLTKDYKNKTIADIKIDNTKKWQKKHSASIIGSYKKSRNFEEVFESIKPCYERKFESLSEYCLKYLKLLLPILGVETDIVLLSSLDVHSKKSDLILDVCRKLKVKRYLSGANGVDYLDECKFHSNGISIDFQNYECVPYPQLGDNFIPALSVLDYLFNKEDL